MSAPQEDDNRIATWEDLRDILHSHWTVPFLKMVGIVVEPDHEEPSDDEADA